MKFSLITVLVCMKLFAIPITYGTGAKELQPEDLSQVPEQLEIVSPVTGNRICTIDLARLRKANFMELKEELDKLTDPDSSIIKIQTRKTTGWIANLIAEHSGNPLNTVKLVRQADEFGKLFKVGCIFEQDISNLRLAQEQFKLIRGSQRRNGRGPKSMIIRLEITEPYFQNRVYMLVEYEVEYKEWINGEDDFAQIKPGLATLGEILNSSIGSHEIDIVRISDKKADKMSEFIGKKGQFLDVDPYYTDIYMIKRICSCIHRLPDIEWLNQMVQLRKAIEGCGAEFDDF